MMKPDDVREHIYPPLVTGLLFQLLFAVPRQILNPNPFPGLTLSPVCGVVPVGGVALISATLTPNAVMKFDSQVNVAVRNGKSVEVRVSGSVEPPLVDIDLVRAAVVCVDTCVSRVLFRAAVLCNT